MELNFAINYEYYCYYISRGCCKITDFLNISCSDSKCYCYILWKICILQHSQFFWNSQKTSRGKVVFHKKPLGRRWYLMSSPVKGCEFSIHYVWNGAKARLCWNTTLPLRTFHQNIISTLTLTKNLMIVSLLFLFYTKISYFFKIFLFWIDFHSFLSYL